MLLVRYFEFNGQVRKALSVVKKRAGEHEVRSGSFDSKTAPSARNAAIGVPRCSHRRARLHRLLIFARRIIDEQQRQWAGDFDCFPARLRAFYPGADIEVARKLVAHAKTSRMKYNAEDLERSMTCEVYLIAITSISPCRRKILVPTVSAWRTKSKSMLASPIWMLRMRTDGRASGRAV